jgi:senataxin
MNSQEAAVAVSLYAKLVQECKGIDLSFRVGVITAYKAQVGELRKQFRRQFGDEILSKVDFNTVDGFQGQEKDIIILSCVRGGNGEGGGIGFLSDVRRMNVALTRARSSLFILGDSRALRTNESWGKLVEDATERGVLREVDRNSFALNAQVSNVKPTSKKTAPPAVKRTNVSPSKQILPAPPGLMTPAELAKARLSNSSNGASSLGIKRRLMDSVKKEEEDSGLPSTGSAQKRSKTSNRDSNAAPALLKSKVKEEELEDGEIGVEVPVESGDERMQGIEYTSKPIAAPTQATANGNGVSHEMRKTASASSNTAVPGGTSGVAPAAPHAVRPAGAPTLVPPKKPATSSMFIQRKVRSPLSSYFRAGQC